MGNIRNKETGKYNWSTIVLALILTGVLLWQGVFAMLGDADASAELFAMPEAFSADIGDGLYEQRRAAWNYAVRNPSADGGVWDQFWATAPFGAAGEDAVPTLPESLTPGLTSTFRDSRGILWRVIAAEGSSRLIMKEHLAQTSVGYNTTNVYTRLSQSDMRRLLNNWGAANLAPELRERARVPNNVDNDVRSNWDTTSPAWSAAENAAAGWTSPGVAAANANEALFILSISEINRYASAVGTTNAERVMRTVAQNWAIHWFLRSPGNSENLPVAIVATNGAISARNAPAPGETAGFRPALWIML